jgi:hypothetical protein
VRGGGKCPCRNNQSRFIQHNSSRSRAIFMPEIPSVALER